MERKLVKINEQDYKLEMKDDDNRHYQEKYWSKEEMRENYQSVKMNRDQTLHTLNAAKKNLQSLKVTLTAEEEKILALMNKAAKRDQYDKLKEQVDNQQKDYDMYDSQVKEIEKVIPEFKRK